MSTGVSSVRAGCKQCSFRCGFLYNHWFKFQMFYLNTLDTVAWLITLNDFQSALPHPKGVSLMMKFIQRSIDRSCFCHLLAGDRQCVTQHLWVLLSSILKLE